MASQEGISQNQTVTPGIDRKLQTRTMAETLGTLEQCSRFMEFIRQADLEYVLRRSGLHTLFAPNDKAMQDDLPSDPEEFLNRHLLAGGMESFDLRRCKSVKTVAGEVLPVQFENGVLRIGNVRTLRPDIPCTNGVIHVVDSVIR